MPPAWGEGGTDISGGTVAVVGQAVDVDSDTSGTVALVHDVLVDGGVGTEPKALSIADLILSLGMD